MHLFLGEEAFIKLKSEIEIELFPNFVWKSRLNNNIFNTLILFFILVWSKCSYKIQQKWRKHEAESWNPHEKSTGEKWRRKNRQQCRHSDQHTNGNRTQCLHCWICQRRKWRMCITPSTCPWFSSLWSSVCCPQYNTSARTSSSPTSSCTSRWHFHFLFYLMEFFV